MHDSLVAKGTDQKTVSLTRASTTRPRVESFTRRCPDRSTVLAPLGRTRRQDPGWVEDATL